MGRRGITPAHAGLTPFHTFESICFWDHPRACGAYLPGFSRLTAVLGSPPRMRGLPCHIFSIPMMPGITPAHAGLTLQDTRQCAGLRDHPRACGAYIISGGINYGQTGSPPRMRGLLAGPDDTVGNGGITPAHAGLTPLIIFSTASLRDHPRACGAYLILLFKFFSTSGSPPRMRGLLTHFL